MNFAPLYTIKIVKITTCHHFQDIIGPETFDKKFKHLNRNIKVF